ncbi:MAG: phosphatase PAP2 family protein [Bacteroidia bacterium]
MKSLANLISYLLHPIFLFTYLYLAYWWLFPYPLSVSVQGIAFITGIVFFNTALLPVIFLLLGKRSLVTQNLSERRTTILVVTVVYTLSYFFFPQQFLPEYLKWVLISIILGMIIAFVVSLRFKISLHASGWGGFVAVFLYLLLTYGNVFYYPFIAVVLLGGLVGFSRLYLNAHTNTELYSGYLSGFIVTALVLFNAPNL